MKEKILVHRCLSCNEHMHLIENVCYCGGPVIISEVSIDIKKIADNYNFRKALHKLKNG